MDGLRIPRIDLPDAADLERVAAQIERHGEWQSLDQVPWPDYPYKPGVRFGLAHTGTTILISFTVAEQAVLAEKVDSNAQVSEDSCVELFLAPPGAGYYYNFEWNCIGTCMAGVGPERHGRELLTPEIIGEIRRRSSLGSAPFPERREAVDWTLTVVLPVEVLIRDRIADLSGLECRGNLFKCGDHLSVPHYLAWSPISTPRPDFHRPEHFGRLLFE